MDENRNEGKRPLWGTKPKQDNIEMDLKVVACENID